MSTNQKIVLLIILVGAVVTIAIYEGQSGPSESDSSDTVASSSSSTTDETAPETDDILNTDDNGTTRDSSSSSSSSSSTASNTDETSDRTDASDSGSSQDMEPLDPMNEIATTEHETTGDQGNQLSEEFLTPNGQSQNGTGSQNGSSNASEDGSEQVQNIEDELSAAISGDAPGQTGSDQDGSGAARDTSNTSGTTDGSSAESGVKQHEVKEGDNLWKIARQYYGSGNQWKRIKQANPDKITDSNHLKQGVTLRIPGDQQSETGSAVATGNAQDVALQQQDTGGTTSRSTGSENSTSLAGADAAADDASQGSSTYTVKDGDRLWNIVKQKYGSATYERVQKVADVNDVEPRELRPGMELELPSDLFEETASAGSSTASPAPSSTSSSDNPPFEAGSGKQWYRVKRGESLWKISEKKLGSGKYFSRIWELNQDRLEDYNSISSGTWVLLPKNP